MVRHIAGLVVAACACTGTVGDLPLMEPPKPPPTQHLADPDAGIDSGVPESFDAGPVGLGFDAGPGGSRRDAGPAPSSKWVSATGSLAGLMTECTALDRLAAKPGTGRVLAGIATRGLWSTDDSGGHWAALGVASGSAQIGNRVSTIVFDPAHPSVFWETGSHSGNGGLYVTRDDGLTFEQLGTMTMTQDLAVDFADPDRKTLVTGTHGHGVMLSTDSGKTFTDISTALPGYTLFVLLLDATTFLVAVLGDPGAAGVYRTENAGASWSQVTTLAPSHDGRFLRASTGTLYLPLQDNTGLMKSTDQGHTWSRLAGTGAAFASPYFTLTPIELSDGSLVTLGRSSLLRSFDEGDTWKPVGEPLPALPHAGDFGGLAWSPELKTFFLWHGDCSGSNAVAQDAVLSAGFDE
jgi:photosystem II stability/assembly factor-like uncharacterized protein